MIGIILQQVDLGGQKNLALPAGYSRAAKAWPARHRFPAIAKDCSGQRDAARRPLVATTSRGLSKVGLGALTVEIAAGQLKSSFGIIACRCGLMQQRQGGGVIGWALPQQGLGLCEKWSSVIHGVSE